MSSRSKRSIHAAVRTVAGVLAVILAASLLGFTHSAPAAADPGGGPTEVGYLEAHENFPGRGIFGPTVRMGHLTMEDRGNGVTRFTYVHTLPNEAPFTCGDYLDGERPEPMSYKDIFPGVTRLNFQILSVDGPIAAGGATLDPWNDWDDERVTFQNDRSAPLAQGAEVWFDVVLREDFSLYEAAGGRSFLDAGYSGGYYDDELWPQGDACGRFWPSYTFTEFVRTLGEADFEVGQVEDQPGGFVFTPEYASGEHTWDFGDGYESAVVSPTHVYEAPGTFMVTHCRTLAAESDCLAKPVVVEANSLTAWVRLARDDGGEAGDFALGDEFSVRLGFEVSDDGVGGIEDITAEYSPEEFLANANLDLVMAAEDPAWPDAPFSMEPGESEIWEWRVTASRAGPLRVFNRISGNDAAGRPMEPVEVNRPRFCAASF